MRLATAALALAVTFTLADAQAAEYRVGSSSFCSHGTVQAAVNAAQANPGPDTILVTREISYAQQAITIDTDQVLTIAGFLSCGSDFTDTNKTVLDGGGGSNESVFRIQGGPNSVITLSGLIIRNGDPSVIDGQGGGIRYQGRGRLLISDSGVINNVAVKGGGIYAHGDVDSALLEIGANVTISGNTARGDGGGVFVNGMALRMNAPNSIIAFNKALGDPGFKGYGGGLAVRSTGSRNGLALVSSGGVGALGAIYGNEAKWGGGVAVSAGADADVGAALRLYSTEADRPGAIRGNFASEGGGAIYLWPNDNAGSGDGEAEATLFRAEITGNAAPEGAAVYIDNSDITDTTLGEGGNLELSSATPPEGGLPCGQNVMCGVIADNIAETANGTDTDGALIYQKPYTYSIADRWAVRNNQVGRLVDGHDDGEFTGAATWWDHMLIAGNSVRQQLMRGSEHAEIRLTASTLADNSIGAAHVFAVDRDEFLVNRSILWHPGKITLAGSAGRPAGLGYVIASEVVSLGGTFDSIVAEPRFIDPARGDYRLRAASPAVDFSPPVAGENSDAFGLPRNRDLAVIPAQHPDRIRDTGAFERQALLPLVLNGDFQADTNLWLLPVGHAGNYQVVNAPGSSAGSGSAQVAGSSSTGRLLGYAQCIEIPGPGTYALNGSARSEGDPALSNDTALIWELRLDGGAGCIDGTITSSGIHALSSRSSTDQWVRPAQAALINVPEASWNFRTSLTVLLAVYPNASNDGYNGLFDRVTLELAAGPLPDELFRDGFESP